MEGTSRFRQRLAVLLAVLAIGEALAIIALGSSGDPRFVLDLGLISLGFTGTVVLFPVMGALIIQRRPSTKVAWLMVALGICIGIGLVAYAYGVVATPPDGHPGTIALTALVLSQLFFVPSIGGLTTWILLLFPTDELLTPRWRWAGVVGVAATLTYVAGTIFRPGQFDSTALPGVVNPLGASGELGVFAGQLGDAANLVGAGCLALAASSLVLRYRRADPVVAAQIRWLALVAVLAVAALAVSLLPLPQGLDDVVFGLGLVFTALMPVAIGIAITRYRLYEIDRLINRALVYGSLTAILAGIFTAGVGLAQRMFIAVTHETSDAAVVGATLIVATLYAPLRKRLEAFVDQRFKYESQQFGAYRAQLEAYLELADPAHALERLARETYGELGAAGVAIVDRDDELLATLGIWPQPIMVRVPVGRGQRSIGTLLVGPRRDGRPHDAREVERLAEIANLVGLAGSGGPSREGATL